MEYMIVPTFPPELAHHKSGSGVLLKDVIHKLINSGEIENIRQADLMMQGFGYAHYVTDYLKNKHLGTMEKLGGQSKEIRDEILSYGPQSLDKQTVPDGLGAQSMRVEDEAYRMAKKISQETGEDEDELLGRFFASQKSKK